MPRNWNRRFGRDGVVRAEPGACAPARFARRQADYGRRWGAFFAWERCAMACLMRAAVVRHMCVHVPCTLKGLVP